MPTATIDTNPTFDAEAAGHVMYSRLCGVAHELDRAIFDLNDVHQQAHGDAPMSKQELERLADFFKRAFSHIGEIAETLPGAVRLGFRVADHGAAFAGLLSHWADQVRGELYRQKREALPGPAAR